MFLLKVFFSCMLAYLPFFEMFASETDAIIDRPRLHLCISPDARGEVSFVVERCIEPDRKVVFDSFRFVADDSLKKWRYQVNVFDSRRPCGDMEVRTTLNFTKKDYMLLQAYLEDPGSGNDADFVEGGHRLQASSSVSEFLNEVQKLPKFVNLIEVQKLPKFVSLDSDDSYLNTSCKVSYKKIFGGCSTIFFVGTCSYLAFHYWL